MYKQQLFLAAAVALVLLSTRNMALAQDSAPQSDKPSAVAGKPANRAAAQDPTDEDMKLLRKDLRSQKKQIVAANMDLTDVEAEKFWPVYDQYTADAAKINDTKAALIKDYWQTFDTMNGDQAESYIRKRAAVEESLMDLRLKYIPVFRKVLSGRQTALFFQIDWRLGLIIDLQLAQMPLIDP
jgi:predicted transglutaminase-like cysteine proteinase